MSKMRLKIKKQKDCPHFVEKRCTDCGAVTAIDEPVCLKCGALQHTFLGEILQEWRGDLN